MSDAEPVDLETFERLIPKPQDDDLEDVSWGLSTAHAMWNRGDHAEAIKWVRRAASSGIHAVITNHPATMVERVERADPEK